MRKEGEKITFGAKELHKNRCPNLSGTRFGTMQTELALDQIYLLPHKGVRRLDVDDDGVFVVGKLHGRLALN